MRFSVKVNKNDGYVIRFLEDVDTENLEFIIDEINVFDDDSGDDVIIEVDGSELNFSMEKSSEDENAFEIIFEGNLTADMSDDELSLLVSKEFKVDYNLIIEGDGDELEQDEAYELIHNKNIKISKS